jgi:TonB family protein
LQAPRSDAPPSAFVGSAGVVISAAVHVVTFVVLGLLHPAQTLVAARQPVEVDVVTLPAPVDTAPPEAPAEEPKAPEPEPEPVAPPPKVRVPKAERAPVPPPEAKVPDTKPPAPAEETIADFSGTTLTGEGAGGWASAVGNGAAMNGPIGKPGAAVTGRDVRGVAGGVVGGQPGGTGIRIAGPDDLSRAAQQPDQEILNAALERNYPKTARMQGIEGSSRIKLRILASGRSEPIATISESYPGFAEACRATLRSMRFSPALDRAGQPVATEIVFPCTFSVE